MPPLEDRLVASFAGEDYQGSRTAGRELASLRDEAEVLPLEIRRQLSIAIEELDLLCFFLHEETLMRVVRKSDAA
jgi:hypothetical protein